ncbi:MAG TPA: DUF4150 domain-containing protein [Gammaproteobacteria bacterium]|nr:DUF4150 domain-containing protein [Gammaproteobacteria bacterium]
MFPMSTMMGGTALATVPDVCKVPAPPAPPIPTPFPNIAQLNQTLPPTASKTVKVLNQAVVLKNSQISMSSGDEAGTLGGVTSSMIKGPVKFSTASALVKIEGQAAVYLTCQTQHNGSNANTIGVHAAPSQTVVLISG